MSSDLNTLELFVTVAETRNFRAAAERLGVTRSAVSQGIRRLETTIGIALFNRTTRSVSLTEAGERFHAQVAPAILDIRAAVSSTTEFSPVPAGQLRLAVSSIAERFISGGLLASFVEAYPEVRLDVTITDEEFDIVAQGYDAGVRLGEVIEQDMIAIPVSRDQRQLAVASPAYIERHGAPRHPRDLTRHRCIGWRREPGVAPYRWEFEEAGREIGVAVNEHVTTNDMWLMIRMACAGGGITFGMEETFRPYVQRGELVPLLEDFLPAFPGFFLYYPGRRNLAPKLRAMVDHARRHAGQVAVEAAGVRTG